MNRIQTRRQTLKSALALTAATGIPGFVRAEAAPLRVGVIGHTGRGDYGHGLDTLWRNLPETVLVSVADPDEEGRRQAAERLELSPEKSFADYDTLLRETHPDLVAVAPRHIDQHADMVIAAAEAGVKGIYLEKPFCRNLGEANAIVEACRKHGTRLAIAHRNRYHPVLPVVNDLIAAGKIGQLLEIRARGKEDQRGGCLDLWVLGSHLLDLVISFTGDPVACSAVLLQDGKPATAADVIEGSEGVGPIAGNALHARFETTDGLPVFFDSVRNAGSKEAGFGLQFIGTEGVFDFRADAEPLVHLRRGNPFNPKADLRPWEPVTSGGIGKPEPLSEIRSLVGGHLAPARDLIAAIRENRLTLCNEEAGRTVVGMTMGVFSSHVEGGKRVSLPIADTGNPLAGLNPVE